MTEANVYDYVRKYAEYRMIKTQEKALEVHNLIFLISVESRNLWVFLLPEL